MAYDALPLLAVAVPLKRARRLRGLSVRGLARAAGVHPSTVWEIETRRRRRPHPATCAAIAGALSLRIEDVEELVPDDAGHAGHAGEEG